MPMHDADLFLPGLPLLKIYSPYALSNARLKIFSPHESWFFPIRDIFSPCTKQCHGSFPIKNIFIPCTKQCHRSFPFKNIFIPCTKLCYGSFAIEDKFFPCI